MSIQSIVQLSSWLTAFANLPCSQAETQCKGWAERGTGSRELEILLCVRESWERAQVAMGRSSALAATQHPSAKASLADSQQENEKSG